MRSTRSVSLSAFVLGLCAVALLPPTAGARVYRDGDFRITAPGGWELKKTGKGGHVLTCGTAEVGFARFKPKKKAKVLGNALIRQTGLVAQEASGGKKKFKATLAGMRGDVQRQGGISIRKKAGVLNVSAWAVDSGTSGQCTGRATRSERATAQTSALIDELATIGASAAGGRIRNILIKQVQFVANPPIPLRRYEVCSQQAPLGTAPCSSALVPINWFPNIYAEPGFIQGIGAPGNIFRGQFTLGGVGAVFQPTCGFPFNANGLPERPFTGNPADAVVNVWPQQQAYAARFGGPSFTPITNVQILAVLRSPWLPGFPSGLFLVRWNQDGTTWSSLFGAAIVQNAPDACYWAWYFSYVAAPDAGFPGVATALFQTWASWRLSYEPITQRSARASVSGALERRIRRALATASAGGDTEAPTAAGPFAVQKQQTKMPDLRDIAP